MKRPKLLKAVSKTLNQEGMASFVIVGVLVILLALISVGFAKIMDRAQTNSLNNQLSAAANYAAQSALKDASTYVVQNPSTANNSCQPGSGTGLYRNAFSKGTNLSSNANNSAAYTCMLVNPTPKDLEFRQVPPDQSQIFNIEPTTVNNIDQIMISWQGSNPNNRAFPASASNNLPDETSWGNNGYTPMLRVTLYPIKNNNLNVPADRTFFLYPYSGGNPLSVATQNYNNADGQLISVPCNSSGTRNTGGFNGSADYDCNVIIKNIATGGSPAANADSFFARVTPLYAGADFKIKANYLSNVSPVTVAFQKGQSVIDVSAKDGTAVKRLQARVDISNTSGSSTSSIANIIPGDNDIPEFGAQSAEALCKRLVINGGSISSAPTGAACSGVNLLSTPPQVNVTANPSSLVIGSGPLTSTISWGIIGLASKCTYTSSPAIPQWDSMTPNQLTSGSINVTFNATVQTYSFTLQCQSGAGPSNVSTATVDVTNPPSPPPAPPPPGPGPGCNPLVNPNCNGTGKNPPPSCPAGIPPFPSGPDPRQQCDYMMAGIYAVQNWDDPLLIGTNRCGDTIHLFVVCARFTALWNLYTSSAACYLYWQPTGGSAIRESGNLFIFEQPSGFADAFTFGWNPGAGEQLNGNIGVQCVSNQDGNSSYQWQYVDNSGYCAFNPSYSLCPGGGLPPPPPPPPPGPPSPPPLPPPPICPPGGPGRGGPPCAG